MRLPIFKIVNDDDPMDYVYPVSLTPIALKDTAALDDETLDECLGLRTGESVTVGGGAAPQFTITRIR